MMTRLLIMMSLIFTTFCNAQEYKLKKQKENKRNGKARYTVIKEQPTVKHGRYYIKAYGGSCILMDGQYVLNEKTGVWIERYRIESCSLRSQGSYKKDVKVGTWSYFNHKGDSIQVYDYNTKVLKYSYTRSNLKAEGASLFPAEYIGGQISLSYSLNSMISIPSELNTTGTNRFKVDTKVTINITEKGKVKDVTFSEEIGYGIDEDIIEWLKSDTNLWEPAVSDNQTIEGKIVMPIRVSMMF